MASKAPRGKAATRRGAKAPARATNNQTRDALAMADMLSSDSRTRSPRAPVSDAFPASAARETPPTSATPAAHATAPTSSPAARATSETRTTSAAHPAGAIVVSRGEVDRALADFSALTAAIRASFSDAGVVVESVAGGTIFARAGLEAGDTITSIDGARLRSLDDAANLYARAATASALVVQLVRNGTPVTLHVVIQ